MYEYIFRAVSVLVSTDVAAMGLDVMDLNISVNIGLIEIITNEIPKKNDFRPSEKLLED